MPQNLQRRELLVFDLALDGRSSSRTFAAGPFGYSSSNVSVDASGTRLLTFDAGIQLRDAADGRLVAKLVDTGSDVPRRGGLLAARILSDGQVVTMEGAPLDGARGHVSRSSARTARSGARRRSTPGSPAWRWARSCPADA
ncbi:MAG: hypothetical protein U0599_14810 [Vicinamibacteria bacterium]